MKYYVLVLCAISLLVSLVGCASIGSTLLSRDESNSWWTRYRCLRGVPITLKVPTHVKIYIYEKHILQTVNVGGVRKTQRVKLPFPIRDFAQEFIFDEKIFTVDFKRPAAGAYNLDINMTQDQYIQSVKHDVTDDTIARVGDLIDKIAPDLFKFPSPSGDDTDINPVAKFGNVELPEIKSVVAVGIFEIDAPDFEHQLTEFINCHLNKAHDAWVVPPNLDSIHRRGIEGSFHQSDICNEVIEVTGIDDGGTYYAPPLEELPAPISQQP